MPGVLGELFGPLGESLQNLLRGAPGPDTISVSVLAMGEGSATAVGGHYYRRGTALVRTSCRKGPNSDPSF